MIYELFMLFIDFTRISNDRNVSEQWNLALGFETNKMFHGFVCFKHFENDCFNGNKLKVNAINTIIESHSCSSIGIDAASDITNPDLIVQPNETNEQNHNRCFDQVDQIPSTSSSSYLVAPTAATVDPMQCTECKKKDQWLQMKDVKIRMLSTSTQKMRESMKLKDAKIQEMLTKCRLYDELKVTLEQSEFKNQEITKQLKATKYKIWALEKVRRDLKTTINELSKKSLITEEQRSILEVCV